MRKSKSMTKAAGSAFMVLMIFALTFLSKDAAAIWGHCDHYFTIVNNTNDYIVMESQRGANYIMDIGSWMSLCKGGTTPYVGSRIIPPGKSCETIMAENRSANELDECRDPSVPGGCDERKERKKGEIKYVIFEFSHWEGFPPRRDRGDPSPPPGSAAKLVWNSSVRVETPFCWNPFNDQDVAFRITIGSRSTPTVTREY